MQIVVVQSGDRVKPSLIAVGILRVLFTNALHRPTPLPTVARMPQNSEQYLVYDTATVNSVGNDQMEGATS